MNHKLFGREIPARLGAFLQLENRSIAYLKTSARREFLARQADRTPPPGHRLWYDTHLQAGIQPFFKTPAAAWLSPYYWLQVPLSDALFPLYFVIVPLLALWQKVVRPLATRIGWRSPVNYFKRRIL